MEIDGGKRSWIFTINVSQAIRGSWPTDSLSLIQFGLIPRIIGCQSHTPFIFQSRPPLPRLYFFSHVRVRILTPQAPLSCILYQLQTCWYITCDKAQALPLSRFDLLSMVLSQINQKQHKYFSNYKTFLLMLMIQRRSKPEKVKVSKPMLKRLVTT